MNRRQYAETETWARGTGRGGAECQDLPLHFNRRVECLCDATDAWGQLMHRLLPGPAGGL